MKKNNTSAEGQGSISKRRTVIFSCAAVVFVYALMAFFGVGCPIKHMTGISCMGCGMSRAYLCAFKLDFVGAFHYHPLWMLVPVVAAFLFLFWRRKQKNRFGVVAGIFCILMVAVYAYRMAVGSDVVVFEPETGAIFNLFRKIHLLFK